MACPCVLNSNGKAPSFEKICPTDISNLNTVADPTNLPDSDTDISVTDTSHIDISDADTSESDSSDSKSSDSKSFDGNSSDIDISDVDIPDTDVSDSEMSDDDSEYPVAYPSTLPRFSSDLNCFERIFPSLICAMGMSAEEDAFEVGWVAGCVHDVILCLILHLTDNHSQFPKDQSHLLTAALEARCYRPLEKDETPPEKGLIEMIRPKQLLNFYNLIHEAVEVKHLSRPAVALTDAEVEVKIGEKETMFCTMLENALKEMWDVNEEDCDSSLEEFYYARAGWQAAREGKWSYPYWVYGPANVHGPVHLEPDDTPVEFMATGDAVMLSAFSVPYTDTRRPEGACIVCMEELAGSPSQLVVAKCTKGHIFHAHCLYKWVNGSAMGNSNMCPHDRERICDPRPRMHPDEEVGIFDTPVEDTDMDAEKSDQEGSDADAEGSDDEEYLSSMIVDDDEEDDHEEDLQWAEELEEAALFRFQQAEQMCMPEL